MTDDEIKEAILRFRCKPTVEELTERERIADLKKSLKKMLIRHHHDMLCRKLYGISLDEFELIQKEKDELEKEADTTKTTTKTRSL